MMDMIDRLNDVPPHCLCPELRSNAATRIAALECALLLALPYVETAESDAAYKPGAVKRVTQAIRADLGRQA
jgi:hypothetical protein